MPSTKFSHLTLTAPTARETNKMSKETICKPFKTITRKTLPIATAAAGSTLAGSNQIPYPSEYMAELLVKAVRRNNAPNERVVCYSSREYCCS